MTPNLPDLNLVGYKIWSMVQETVYRQNVQDVNSMSCESALLNRGITPPVCHWFCHQTVAHTTSGLCSRKQRTLWAQIITFATNNDWATFVLTLVKYLCMTCWKTQCFRKFLKANISEGSVATCFKCGGIFNGYFIANLLLILGCRNFKHR